MTAIEFLQQCIPNGKQLLFPNIQLSRDVYNEVKRLLEGVGGRWEKAINGFAFRGDVDKYLSKILDGEKINLMNQFQFFQTPVFVANKMAEMAEITPDFNGNILEPSAGCGALISAVHRINPNIKVDAVELMEENIEHLNQIENVTLVGTDFLQTDFTKKYDIIIANPPFSKNQDIKHIEKMWKLLKDGGVLVVITSTHWKISKGKLENKFYNWVQDYVLEEIELPENTFQNTKVKTLLLKFKKPKKQNSMSRKISVYRGIVEISVKSELFGFTTATGTVEFALETGYLPCGDGSDYKLTKSELNYIKNV